MDSISPEPSTCLDIKAELMREFEGYFPVSPFDYRSVVALVLYWKEADDPEYKKEAEQVCELFRNKFCFKVFGEEPLAIPTKNSEVFVRKEIENLLFENDDASNLIILHYGGHGDRDDRGKGTKRSVWAA